MPIKDKKTKSVTTPLLDKVNNPNDLKFLKLEDLRSTFFRITV